MKRIALFTCALIALCLAFPVLAHEEAEIPGFTIEFNSEGISIPQELSAGLTTLNFDNQTEAPVAPILARLNEEVTMEQFIEVISTEGPEAAIPLVSLLGGTEIAPEQSFAITFDFAPGNHLLLEFNSEVPAIQPFVVVEAEEAVEAELEEAAVPVIMADYLFSMPLEIEAGVQTWYIENGGEQWHEMSIARVEPGTTVDQIMAAFMAEESGEQPEIVVEETFFFAPVSAGEYVQFELELEPGTYFVVCFLPSFEDGQPHIMHGMYQFITVTEAE
jgi:hypothetical protein